MSVDFSAFDDFLPTTLYRSMIPCEEPGCGKTPTSDFSVSSNSDRRVHLCRYHANIPSDQVRALNWERHKGPGAARRPRAKG